MAEATTTFPNNLLHHFITILSQTTQKRRVCGFFQCVRYENGRVSYVNMQIRFPRQSNFSIFFIFSINLLQKGQFQMKNNRNRNCHFSFVVHKMTNHPPAWSRLQNFRRTHVRFGSLNILRCIASRKRGIDCNTLIWLPTTLPHLSWQCEMMQFSCALL